MIKCLKLTSADMCNSHDSTLLIFNFVRKALIDSSPIGLTQRLVTSIIAIAIVFLGGFVTYLVTTRIEEQKRWYELKKEVYFDVIDAIVDMMQKHRELRVEQQKVLALNKLKPEKTTETTVPLIEEALEFTDIWQLRKMKLKVCASGDVNSIFVDVIKNIDDPVALDEIVMKHLIPAMQDDLMKSKKQHWWQF